MSKEILFQALSNHLRQSPEDAPEALQVVSDALTLFRASVEKRRNGQALNAINDLVWMIECPRESGRVDTPWHLLTTCMLAFPNGLAGHSQAAAKFWGRFLERVRRHPVDLTWLREVRGEEYYEWWQRVVIPAIAKAEAEVVA